MGQFVRAAAASSRERQRRHERAVRDEQTALAAFNARGEKIDAEWNKILARLDTTTQLGNGATPQRYKRRSIT